MVPRTNAPKIYFGGVFFITDELEIIKSIDDVYLKLVYLIKIACINQNNKKLMREIYKEVNKIPESEDKITYLINIYLNNFGYDKVDILGYIGIPIGIDIKEIIDVLASQTNRLFHKNYSDNIKSNIDYNLNHLKNQDINKTKIFIKDIRRNKMPKVIRKKREL